jgi:hypothetical protein
MSTQQDVVSALERMDSAKEALLSYVQGSAKNIETHNKLADELKAATDNFVEVLSRSGQ